MVMVAVYFIVINSLVAVYFSLQLVKTLFKTVKTVDATFFLGRR
jgi:uncharacterized membrane protein YecN with MAPEG domain